MSAVEILAEASWVVEGSYSSARRMTCIPGGCGPLLAEVLKVMKADLTKNFESYGRQVMGFGGSRKSPKNGIPFLGNPINFHHDIPDSYFQAFCGVLQKRTGLAFLGVGCTTMACNPRFQQDNEYRCFFTIFTWQEYARMMSYWLWHCRILFKFDSTEHLPLPQTNSSSLKISGWKVQFARGARPIFRGHLSFPGAYIHQLTVSIFGVYLDHQLLGNAAS